MTKNFSQGPIDIAYPENWQLETGESGSTRHYSLASPNACTWELYVIEASENIDDWMDLLTGKLAEQYDSFEQQELDLELEGTRLAGFEIYFFYLDLLISGHLLKLPPNSAGEHQVVMFQGESRAFDQMLPVFHAITISQLRSQTQSNA